MNPTTVVGLNYSFCSDNHTVLIAVNKCIKSSFKVVRTEFFNCFGTVAYKDLICVMVVVMISARAIAMLIVFVVMVMMLMFVVVVATFVIVVMVVMLMFVVVMAAFVIVVMVVMLVFVVMMAAAFIVVMMCLLLEPFNFRLKSIRSFNSIKQLCAGKFIPIGSNYNGVRIVLLYKRDTLIDLFLIYKLCMAENDASGILNLIIKELTEILHMHFALFCVDNGCKTAEYRPVCICAFDCLYNVRKLSNTGRLNENSVRRKLIDNFGKSCREVTHK